MNKQRLRKKQREEMRKPRGWHRKLHDGCTAKRKRKEKMPKKKLRKPRKQLKKQKKQK